MSEETESIRELQAEVRRLAELQRRQGRVRSGVLVALVVLAAGAALAQPMLTTFNADAPALASQVNANFAQVTQFTVPQGGIIFYDGTSCPSGWTQVAQGRAIVGRPTTGTNALTFGTAMVGNTEPSHGHSTGTAGGHSHGGQTGTFANWVTGTVNWAVQVGSSSPYHHTHGISTDGDHTHSVSGIAASAVMPFIYYTACRKN